MLECTPQDAMPLKATGPHQSRLPKICVDRDISESAAFLEIRKRHEEVLRPGENEASDMVQLDISPDGKYIAGAATICKEMKGVPSTRLVVIDTAAKDCGLQTFGERNGSGSLPKWSPGGKKISFLSDIKGRNQLFLLNFETGDVKTGTDVPGTIEQQSWSQDSCKLLLLVAGLGADSSGSGGGKPLDPDEKAKESWLPHVDRAAAPDEYRTLWVYDIESETCEQASPEGLNFWEAVWISPTKVVGVCSDLPGEEAWYTSSIREIDLETKAVRMVFSSDVPIQFLAASPSGKKIAFANSIASDRFVLKGDLRMIDLESGEACMFDTKCVDIGGSIVFCGEDVIVATGSRVDEEVIIQFDRKPVETFEIWSSREHSTGNSFMSEAAARMVGGEVQIAFVRSGFFSPPTLIHGTKSSLAELKIFASPSLQDDIQKLGESQYLTWKAPDGIDIHGFLIQPSNSGSGPPPTILFIHGGPVWQWRPRYVASHGQQVLERALLSHGFAIFKPNPRGSSGRGQEFIRHVFGDMGGKDTYDYLSGLDELVTAGLADPDRLGVYGGSYGGFMTSWLVTQSPRFAAAVPLAPCTDWVSCKYNSNIGRFFDDFLADSPHDPKGKYFTRSPIHHVDKVKSPTLNIVGAKDQCAPPGQGQEFHQALVEKGTPSVLLSYPEEGHGIRQMPALLDFVARTTEWFKHYMS